MVSRFDRYDEQARNALRLARDSAIRLHSRMIAPEHLLAGVLDSADPTIMALLASLGAPSPSVREELRIIMNPIMRGAPWEAAEPELRSEASQILLDAEAEAGQDEVSVTHLLLGILRRPTSIAANVLGEGYGVTYDRARVGLEALRASGGGAFAATHSARYHLTPTLNLVSRDLTSAALDGSLDPLIGRERELAQTMQTLTRRRKNNPVLVGAAGVGKTAIAEGLAQAIASGAVPQALRDLRLVSLDVGLLTVGAKYRGDFEERLKRIVDELLRARSVILFIDELQALLGVGGAEGSIDAANLFKPILARGEIQIIGAATQDDFKRIMDRDAALERRFQPITVPEATVEETIGILEGLRPRYERFHRVTISNETISAAVRLASRYIHSRALPDKAIDLLDEAAARRRVSRSLPPAPVIELREQVEQARAARDRAISRRQFARAADLRDQLAVLRHTLWERETQWRQGEEPSDAELAEEDIADVVTRWTGIPTLVTGAEDVGGLIELEATLSRRVIGQSDAISAVARAVRRARAGVRDRRRPIASFIFAGPTGVGKTELARTLAAALFGDEDALIKLDMSEFMERHNAARLVGAPPGYVGYDQAGQLTEAVKRRPYSVVLLDEIEKAHPQVYDMLLQVMEDGVLADAKGHQTDFRHTIIIMTTNLGAAHFYKGGAMGFHADALDDPWRSAPEKMRAAIMPDLESAFRPEFLNRVDDILVFRPLGKTEARQIVALMLHETASRLAERQIALHVTEAAYNALIVRGFSQEYGARALRREIQTHVEDQLAEELLTNRAQTGAAIVLDADATPQHNLILRIESLIEAPSEVTSRR